MALLGRDTSVTGPFPEGVLLLETLTLAGDRSWVTDEHRWDLTELEKFKSKDRR